MSTINATQRMPFGEPQGYTLRDLLVRVGRKLGATNEVDQVSDTPVDTRAIDQLRDAVNDGIRRFTAGHDRWSWLMPWVALELVAAGDGPLNINGDPARYRLPPGVEGAPVSDWTFTDASSNYTRIQQTSVEAVRQRFASSDSSGVPYLACATPIRDQQPGDGADQDKPAWQLIVYPRPQQNYTIEAQFRVIPHELVDLDERHIAGAQHDHAILQACLLEAALVDEVRNAKLIPFYQAEYERALANSIRIDLQNVPDRVGFMHDPGSMTRSEWRQRTYEGGVTVDGVDPNG